MKPRFITKVKDNLKEFEKTKLLYCFIAIILVVSVLIFNNIRSRKIETISINNKEFATKGDTTSNDEIESYTVYAILNQADRETELGIGGNKVKITSLDNSITITALNVFTDAVIYKDAQGNITVPEEGIKLKIDGIQEENIYEIEIKSSEVLYDYTSTIDSLILEINAQEINQMSARIKEITKITEEGKSTIESSEEGVAVILYENEDGKIKIKGNNELEKYYIISDSNELTDDELENSDWMLYNEDEGLSISKNGIVYSRTKYKNGSYSSINRIYISNIDKLKPDISVKEVKLDTVYNEAYVTLDLSDKIATADYGKSGVYGYAVTTDDEEPAAFIEVLENIDQTVRVDGIPNNGIYYAWVSDKAGNVEKAQFTVDFITESEDEVLLLLNAPIANLKGKRFSSFQKLIKELDDNEITQNSGEVVVQLVKDINNETVKIKDKNIVLDLNGYSVTSKLLEATFDVVNGKLNIIDDKLSIADYIDDQEILTGLQNKFSANDENGRVISTNFVAIQIQENGTFTLGEDESVNAIPNSSPVIRGQLKGILNVNGIFNFYDGEIISKVPVDGKVSDKPALYDITVASTEENEVYVTRLLKTAGVEVVIGKERYKKIEDAISDANRIIGSISDNIEIDMVTDITREDTIVISEDKNITIDLNGFIINNTSNNYVIKNLGELNIIDTLDNEEQENGKIYNVTMPSIFNELNANLTLLSGVVETSESNSIVNKGSFTIEGGKITATGITENPIGILNETSGKVIVKSGEINVSSSKVGTNINRSFAYGIYNKGELETEGGIISAQIGKAADFTKSYGIYNENVATISQTTINSCFGVYNVLGGEINLTRNNISSEETIRKTEYSIYNEGTATLVENKIYSSLYGIDNKGTLNTNGDELFIQNEELGIETYGILNEESAVLISDNIVESGPTYGISNAGNAKINNCNLSVNTRAINNTLSGIVELNGSQISEVSYGIYNEGIVTAEETSINASVNGINNRDQGSIETKNTVITSSSSAIYNNGNFESKNDEIISSNCGIDNSKSIRIINSNVNVNSTAIGTEERDIDIYGIKNSGENLIIESANIIVTSLKEEYINQYGISNTSTGKIILGENNEVYNENTPKIISGSYGIYNNYGGELYYYDGSIESKKGIYGSITDVPDEYYVKIDEENDIEKIVLSLKQDEDYLLKVAYVGDNEENTFSTLQDAVNACEEEGTITLIDNVTVLGTNLIEIGENQKVTINFNGHNIYSYINEDLITNNGELTIYSNLGVTKIEGFSRSSIHNNGILNVNGFEIESSNYGIYNDLHASATLNNVTVQGKENSIYNEGNIQINNNSILMYSVINTQNGVLDIEDTEIDVENIDKEKFFDKTLNTYVDIRSYGIYNDGILNGEKITINVEESDTEFDVYGIYNDEHGLMNVLNSDIQVTIYNTSQGYGIYNNSTLNSIVEEINILVKDTDGEEDQSCTMYGVYNTENSNLNISNSIIVSQGNLVDAKTKRYSNESYGIYNEGNINLTKGDIQVSNVYNKAYGIQIKENGYLKIDNSDITITQTGIASGFSTAYGIDNLGEIEYTDSRIDVSGYFNVYGINNGKNTNVTIYSGNIKANHTKVTAYTAYGIRNEGILNVIKGQINAIIAEAGTAYGINNTTTGNVTLGDNSSNKLDLTSPSISGTTNGIYSDGKINFYDGIIKGTEENSLFSKSIDVRRGCNVVKYKHGDNSEYNIDEGYEITVLDKIVIARLYSNNEEYSFIEDAVADAESEDIITLTADTVVGTTIVIPYNKNIKFNLAGYTITNSADGYFIENNGTIEIVDESTNGVKGKIVSTSNNAIHNNENGTMILTDINISAIYSLTNRNVICNEGNMTINNSNINMTSSAIGTYAVNNKENGKLSLIGGKIEAILTLAGTTRINSTIYAIYNNGEINFTDTEIYASSDKNYIELYGIYNEHGKIITNNINMNITAKMYAILYGIYNDSEITQSMNNDNLTLYDEKSFTKIYGVYNTNISNIEAKELTINIYGIEYDTNIVNTTWNMFDYHGIYNEGAFNSENNNILINSLYSNGYGIYNEEMGNLSSKDDNITIQHSGSSAYSAIAIYNNGTAYIDTDELNATDEYKPYGIYNETSGVIEINDTNIESSSINETINTTTSGAHTKGDLIVLNGSIKGLTYNGTGYGIYSIENGKITLGKKDTIIDMEYPLIEGKEYGIYSKGFVNFYDGLVKGKDTSLFGGITDISEGYELLIERNGEIEEAKLGHSEGVAYIGTDVDSSYDDLQDAIDACPSNETITLLKDIIITSAQVKNIPSNKTLTINLNGKNIKGYSTGEMIHNLGTLTIEDKTNSEVVIDGTAEKMIVNSGSGVLNLNVKVIANKYAIYNEENGIVNINADIESSLDAIYNKDNGTMYINEITIKSYNTGIYNESISTIYLNKSNINVEKTGIYNAGEGKIDFTEGKLSVSEGLISNTIDDIIYGIYNENGILEIDGTEVEITSLNQGIYAYGIYNLGRTTIENINLNMNFAESDIRAFGIYNNSSRDVVIRGGNIVLNDDSTGSRLYGVITEAEGETSIGNTNINVSTPYCNKVSNNILGSNSYGVYNQGKTTIENGKIQVSSSALDTYGIYNAAIETTDPAILTLSGVNIEVRHEDSGKRSIGSYHAYGIWNNSKNTVNINEGTKIEVYDNYSPYGIYTTKSTKILTNNINITVTQTGNTSSSSCKAYGIYNIGEVTYPKGNINVSLEGTNGTAYGVYTVGTFTIGDNNRMYISSNPIINGKTYGVYKNKGALYFYDGTISGSKQAVYGSIDKIEENYKIKNQNSMRLTQLEPTGDFLNSIVVDGQYFESLDIAIRIIAGTDSKSGTIEIYSDLKGIDTELTIPEGVNITIALQGNNITFGNLDTAIINNGILNIIENIDPDENSINLSYMSNENGTLIQNNGILVIGQNDKTENIMLELSGNPAISGNPATIYGATIDGEIANPDSSSGNLGAIKPFYLTKTLNDGEIALSTEPTLNKNKTDWASEDINIEIDADVIPVLKLYSIPITHYSVEYYYDNVIDDTKTDMFALEAGNEINGYTDKNITGYKLDKVEGLPLTVGVDETQNIIRVYYIKDEFNYAIEYYYDGIEDESKKEEKRATYLDVIELSDIEDKNITGYKLDETKSTKFPFVVGAEESENRIKIYYTKDEFNYTIEYYYDGIKDESKTEVKKAEYQSKITEQDIEDYKRIDGYKIEKIENTPLIISENENNNLIKVYQIRDSFRYTIEYYYDNLKDEEATVENTALYNEEITENEIDSKEKLGYIIDEEKTTHLPFIITSNEVENIIKIYYSLDPNQTKTIGYTVEYYKDNSIIIEDTEEYTKNVHVLAPDTIEVEKSLINTENKYIGYKLEKTEPEVIPDTIENGNVIKIYYVRDSFNYTVEYYFNGIKDNDLTVNKTALYNEEISDDDIELNIKNGYKLDEKSSTQLPFIISEDITNNIIRLYYVTDPDQKKTISYTVEYYKDNELVTEDTQTFSKDVQVLEPDVLDVDKSQINTENKYIGYRLDNDKTMTIPDTIINGEVIRIYYVKETFGYIVEYYYEGIKDIEKTEYLNALYGDVITTYTDKNILGYKLDKEEGLPLTISINSENNIIRVYYVIDENQTKTLSYTVEYYKDGIIVDEDTQIETIVVHVLQSDIIEVKTDKINTVNKYMGYKLEGTTPEIIPSTIADKSTIKVYYIKDTFNYTIEYYYDDIKDETKTIVSDALYQTLITIEDVPNKQIEGYILDEEKTTEFPFVIGTNENIIKIFYKKDQFTYRVEYYYNNVIDEKYTEENTALYKTEIESINFLDKIKTGYKFDKIEGIPLVIGINEEENIIRVYYITDESQTKTIKYTVEYYKDNILVDSDTQEYTQTVQVLANDLLDVNKEQINITNKYVGYRFDRSDPEEIPDTIKDGEVLRIYYVRDEFKYKVEYYYNDIIDVEKTEEKYGLYNTVINESDLTKKAKIGYKLNRIEGIPLLISENAENNIIKMYYIVDENATKKISYTVEYYKDNVLVENDIQKFEKTVQVLESDILIVDKTQINTNDKYSGYVLDYTNPDIIPETIKDGEKIKVYYVRDSFSYTVEYYYENEQDVEKTEHLTALYESIVSEYEDKNILGYKLQKVENFPLTISENEENNIIKIYYNIDNDILKELSYTIEYYKDGELVEGDTETITKKVQILQSNVMKVDKSLINTTDKYIGYRFDESIPETIPEEVETGAVIKVYYVIDNTQTKALHYTVEYYKDEELVEDDVEKFSESVQVLHGNTIKVDMSKINTVDKYNGYEFEKTSPEIIPEEVENGTTIKVYYVTKMKKLSYKIEYYKDGKIVEEDTEIVSIRVSELEDNNKIDVNQEQIDFNKYEGYKVEKTYPETIPEYVEDGEIIKVYYVIDESLTKTLTYTIEYYQDSKIMTEDTKEYINTVQILKSSLIKIDKNLLIPDNKYYGYKLLKTEPEDLSNGIESGTIVKAYYTIDPSQTKVIGYTVEYYKDGELVKDDIQQVTKMVQVLEANSLKVDKDNINIVNKYKGYLFERTNPSQIQEYADNGDIIKVYYKKDELAPSLMKTGEESMPIFIAMFIFSVFGIASYIEYRKIKE